MIRPTDHLRENHLDRAVVDESLLPSQVARHLQTCPECRQKVDNLRNSLTALGKIAKKSAPLPRRSIRLPEKASFFEKIFTIPVLKAAPAFIVLLVMSGVFWLYHPMTSPMRTATRVELMNAEMVMTEVTDLSENALSQAYLDICMDSYKAMDAEDDLMDTETEDFFIFEFPLTG